MEYYTQRHGLRSEVRKTNIITMELYALLLDCCEKYYENLAWKYPEKCQDGDVCCGLDRVALERDVKYEIPALFRDYYGNITAPTQRYNIFNTGSDIDEYDQFALLDYIEFVGENICDILQKNWHGYFQHNHLIFSKGKKIFLNFKKDINAIFTKTGLLYQMNEEGQIERIEENSILDENIERQLQEVPEVGIQELLARAIALHKSPNPSDNQDAVEKLWDALERLKSYYTSLDKKDSVKKIIDDIASGEEDFVNLFNTEFVELTKIGNNFRIRHHETNKIDITDNLHYDYFFNRCLSLISLALHYLEENV